MNTRDGLTADQKSQYERDGYVVLRGVLSRDECERAIAHMMDLHAGRKTVEGFAPRQPGDWNRTHNQHLYDPMAMGLMLHPRLRGPLRDCFGGDEPDAVQTMYFFKGSEQRRHQDQYYLPGCMSAWMPLTDVGQENGTIWVQAGSHKVRLIRQGDLKDAAGKWLPMFGAHYDDAVDSLFEDNRRRLGLREVPVEASAGDVVLFHGVLIHRGGPIGRPGSFRHVMANHYIPHGFDAWPYPDWPRFDFDGNRRFTKAQVAGLPHGVETAPE